MSKLKVGIIGVAGYGGGEIARLLLTHPEVELVFVGSSSGAGLALADVLPAMRGRTALVCREPDITVALHKCDILFAAQENGWASLHAGAVLSAGKKLIDLSADLRLRDPETYRGWYKREPAPPDIQAKAVYGLPELFRHRIELACLVANPGCYPTSAVLALAPAITEGLIDEENIVINSLSGVSGAGRSKHSLQYHFPELNESASAYGVGGVHRHTPEIEQALSDIAGHEIAVSFTPHLIPITRGILTTCVAPLADGAAARVRAVYEERYAGEPFVHVLPHGQFPATKHANGTNNVIIGIAVDERLGILNVVAVEDNLIKGAAGQAIQNMNIISGIAETTGLELPGMWP
jgi:N-acetyl-gamma-glutamyl-phosphate reductase